MLFWRMWETKQLLVHSDFHNTLSFYQMNVDQQLFGYPTFFKIAYFVFSTWNKWIQVWDNVSEEIMSEIKF